MKKLFKTKPIEGFEDYLARSDGNIYSLKKKKILSKWVDNVGYYQVVLYKNGKRCYKRVHRLIAESFLFPMDNCNQVNHKDGNKLNCKLSNLEWTTNRDNTKHGYDNNLYYSAKRSFPLLAINKETLEELEFTSIRECAESLNLNRKTLSNILNGSKKTNNYQYDFKLLL